MQKFIIIMCSTLEAINNVECYQILTDSCKHQTQIMLFPFSYVFIAHLLFLKYTYSQYARFGLKSLRNQCKWGSPFYKDEKLKKCFINLTLTFKITLMLSVQWFKTYFISSGSLYCAPRCKVLNLHLCGTALPCR